MTNLKEGNMLMTEGAMKSSRSWLELTLVSDKERIGSSHSSNQGYSGDFHEFYGFQ